MSAPQTVRSATNRLVVLTVLRWLPVGLQAPITVLLAQSRGLSLAEIGLLFTVHGAIVVALELPTGGLADVLGRRPVVVAGAVLYLVSCLVFADRDELPRASSPASCCSAWGGRWTPVRSRPGTSTPSTASTRRPTSHPVSRGTPRPTAAASPSGAVVGGLLPGLLGGRPARQALALPYLGGRRPRPGLHRRGPAAADRGPAAARGQRPRRAGRGCPGRAGAPSAARCGCRSATGRCGWSCSSPRPAASRWWPASCSARCGSPSWRAVPTTARRCTGRRSPSPSAWPRSGRWRRPRCAGCCAAPPGSPAPCLTLLGAGGIAALAGPDVLVLAALGFAAYYLAHGSTWPLLSAVLHSRVTAAHRATAVSAMSLAMALGGILGNLADPGLAAAVSLDAAFLAVAVVVLVAAGGLPPPAARVRADVAAASRPRPPGLSRGHRSPRNARDTRPY